MLKRSNVYNKPIPSIVWYIYLHLLDFYGSGQVIIFHQPRFPWNKGISLTKPPFGVRSCEVAIIWPDGWCVKSPEKKFAGSALEPRKSLQKMGPDELHAMSSMLPWKAPLKNGEKMGLAQALLMVQKSGKLASWCWWVIPLFTRFYTTIQVVHRISEPSTGWWPPKINMTIENWPWMKMYPLLKILMFQLAMLVFFLGGAGYTHEKLTCPLKTRQEKLVFPPSFFQRLC